MIKKIKTEELIVGMFIHDLNCSWLNHPFFKSGKSIHVNTKQIIDKIFEYGIKEVYIDTDKGLDVGDTPDEETPSESEKKNGRPAGKKPVSPKPSAVEEILTKVPVAGTVPGKESPSGPVFKEKSLPGKVPAVPGKSVSGKSVSNRSALVDEEISTEAPHVENAPGNKTPSAPGKKAEKPEKKKSRLVTDASINEEIANAKKIKKETIQTVRKIMDDIKLGKPIQKERVEEDVENIIESVFRNSDALVGLARLRTVTDYLYSHSLSVCVMMVTFGKYLGYDAQTIKEVGLGAMLHDIGAGMVSQRIINKESGLTKEEYENVKEHVQYGYNILLETKGISEKSLMVMYQHHERMNGTGYPRGLKGDEISLYGQAIAIVDVYDALTTKRSYRHKIQPTEALRMIYQWRGNEFNTDLVEHFIRCIGIYPAGTLVGLESGLLGIVVCHKGQDLLQPVLRIVYDTKKDRYLMPYDVDLSNSSDNSAGDSIVSYELPERWNVQPEMYL